MPAARHMPSGYLARSESSDAWRPANLHVAFCAEDRLGGPPQRPRRRLALKTGIVLVACGLAYGWQFHQAELMRAYHLAADIVAAFDEPAKVASRLPPPATLSQPEQPEPIVETPVTAAALDATLPGTDYKPETEPAAPLAPLPQPSADPDDPLQQRALAVGLHPGLSRVILNKLTEEDFRNAEHAIRTALREASEKGTFLWPQRPKAGLAVFRVKFVASAGATCRRYVVAIAKEGWETTAMPMERCSPSVTPG